MFKYEKYSLILKGRTHCSIVIVKTLRKEGRMNRQTRIFCCATWSLRTIWAFVTCALNWLFFFSFFFQNPCLFTVNASFYHVLFFKTKFFSPVWINSVRSRYETARWCTGQKMRMGVWFRLNEEDLDYMIGVFVTTCISRYIMWAWGRLSVQTVLPVLAVCKCFPCTYGIDGWYWIH